MSIETEACLTGLTTMLQNRGEGIVLLPTRLPDPDFKRAG
jgi:hypothetical protein